MSGLALHLIEKEKKERTGKLDLGNCGLTKIPQEVFELEWLTELSFCDAYYDLRRWTTVIGGNNGDSNEIILTQNLGIAFKVFTNLKILRLQGSMTDNKPFPIDIDTLKDLEELILMNVEIRDISFIRTLTALRVLDLFHTEIENIDPLKNLTGLQALDIGSNPIHDIAPLSALVNLETLGLSHTHITNINVASRLINLKILILMGCGLKDIRPLSTLTQINTLLLANNHITDFRPLLAFKKLQALDLEKNEIQDISGLVPFLEQTTLPINLDDVFDTDDQGIGLNLNPITTPPIEVVKEGREAILDWFKANKKALNEIKIILIGEAKAGKTSVLRRLKDGTFDKDEVQTDGVNIESIAFGENEQFVSQSSLHNLKGHFWDFGGQEIMSATHQFFLTNRSVYLFVLDARKDNGVAQQIRQWVQRIRATGGDSPILVVANQIDVNPGFGFENELELQSEFPQILGFLKVSCSEEDGIEELKNCLADLVPKAELFNTQIDERWIKVKDILRKETKSDDEHFLSEKRFNIICDENDLTEVRQKENAISFFHDLGIVLHFDGIQQNLSEYYVLDPYWITYGVYQILTSKIAAGYKGQIPLNELEEIINEEEDKLRAYQPGEFKRINYSTNQRRFLVDILHEFKLGYFTSDREYFVLPDLLPTQEPVELTKAIRNEKERIEIAYKYTYMPKSIVPQLMAEANEKLEEVWRTGCVISHDGCKGLISSYSNRLSVTVIGEHKKKREFMAFVRYTMDEIHQDLPEKPKLQIPLPGVQNQYADYLSLIRRERRGEKIYWIDEPEMDFEISVLLDGIPQDKELKRIYSALRSIKDGQEQLHDKLNDHFALLMKELSNKDLEQELVKTIQESTAEQTANLQEDLATYLGAAFDFHQEDMRTEFQTVLEAINQTNDTELKLKLGLPLAGLTGIDIEGEFNLKNWSQKMYKKYELKLFELMGKL